MMLVPLTAVPSQNVAIVLDGQSCQISVFTLPTGLYFSLTVGSTVVVTTRICRNTAFLINQGYSGFSGDFSFVDTQGQTDPVYTGLGTRYQLVYLEAADFAVAA